MFLIPPELFQYYFDRNPKYYDKQQQVAISQLKKEIDNRLSPPITYTIDLQQTDQKKVIRILVPRGDDPPYAVDDNKIYVRSEAETGLAVRDEIVGLVSRGLTQKSISEKVPMRGREVQEHDKTSSTPFEISKAEESENDAPKTGVEVVSVEERNGRFYYTVRDLRNGNVVKNVTPSSARKLWHYAITRYSKLPEFPGSSKEISTDYGRSADGSSVKRLSCSCSIHPWTFRNASGAPPL